MLMVRSGNFDSHADKCVFGMFFQHHLECLGASHRVSLHDRKLFPGQRAGLQENVVGNRNLADIVQRTGVENIMQVVVGDDR